MRRRDSLFRGERSCFHRRFLALSEKRVKDVIQAFADERHRRRQDEDEESRIKRGPPGRFEALPAQTDIEAPVRNPGREAEAEECEPRLGEHGIRRIDAENDRYALSYIWKDVTTDNP